MQDTLLEIVKVIQETVLNSQKSDEALLGLSNKIIERLLELENEVDFLRNQLKETQDRLDILRAVVDTSRVIH